MIFITNKRSMIFITGFHHSGTSFLAEIIKQFGVNFSGPLDRHNELEKWKIIDDHLIGDWLNPNKELNEYKEMLEYWDNEAYKNPRLMVTARFWMDRFPKAKWISIKRDDADVAISMMADKTRNQNPLFWFNIMNTYKIRFYTAISEHSIKRSDMFHLEFKYSDLYKYPHIVASTIGHFIGKEEKIEEVAKWIEENAKFKTYSR